LRQKLGGGRARRLIFGILPGVSEEWNHRRDSVSAGTPCRVHHDQQLHQVLVSGRTGWLNDENVVAPNVFLDFYVRLAVWERAYCRPTQWHTNVFANAFGQAAIG